MTGVLDPEGVHLAALRRLCDFRGRRVLELGCGDGRLTLGIARDAAHVLAAATAAVDALVGGGRLREEAVDDHDVRKHYETGRELVGDFAGKQRKLPEAVVPRLRLVEQPCAVRERCRLRRLVIR